MTAKADNLIWIDLEMTGLDTDNDRIIEIATIVTNTDLDVIAEGPVIAIHQPDSILNEMDSWNTEHHTQSGLIDRVQASEYTAEDAENKTLEFLTAHVAPGKSPMCGNSICQDRRFMHREMSNLEQFFHYRNLDVSTVKMLASYWYPNVAKGVAKVSQHRALQDIYDSIDELRYYRQHIFKT